MKPIPNQKRVKPLSAPHHEPERRHLAGFGSPPAKAAKGAKELDGAMLNLLANRCLSAGLKNPERGCVVLDQPQNASNFRRVEALAACCGWSSTQPRSFFRHALSFPLITPDPGFQLGGLGVRLRRPGYSTPLRLLSCFHRLHARMPLNET